MQKMQKPTVLFINRAYPPGKGATGRVLRDLAQAFARDGWAVTVLTTGVDSEEIMDGTVRVKKIAAKSSKSAARYAMVWMKLLFAALMMPKYRMIVTFDRPTFAGGAGANRCTLEKMFPYPLVSGLISGYFAGLGDGCS